jgi:hypothetical protein
MPDWFAEHAPAATAFRPENFRPTRTGASGVDWFAQHAPEAASEAKPLSASVGDFAKEATQSLNPKTINDTIQQAFWHPIDTARGMVQGQDQLRQAAHESFKQGDYVGGVRHAINWLIPMLGPRIDEAGNLMGEGEIARGLGAATDVGVQIAAPKAIPSAVERLATARANVAGRLRAGSAQDIREALNPTRHRTKVKAERITPEIQRRGLTGELPDIQAQATEQVGTLGPQIDRVLRQAGNKPVDLTPVRARLDAMKATTYREVPQTMNGRPVLDRQTNQPVMERAVHNPRKLAQIEAVEDLLRKYEGGMNVDQAVAVRRAWDEVISKAGGFDEKAGSGAFGVSLTDWSEANVKRPLAAALRKQLIRSVPDVAALNKEFGFWKDLQDVVTATTSRRVGQRKAGLLTKTVGAGAHAVGAAAGLTGGVPGVIAGSLVAGEVAERLNIVLNSPKWRLTSANLKFQLADALASGNQARVKVSLARIQAAQIGLQAARTGVMVPQAADRDGRK